MGNNVTLIPKQPARHSLLTSTENVVYMPLATKDSHGIVKVGAGLSVTTDGLLSVDHSSDWYNTIRSDVDLLMTDVSDIKKDVNDALEVVADFDDRISDIETGSKVINIYQTKNDSGLVTVNKTVVGGINELKTQTQINVNDIRAAEADISDVRQNYAQIKYVDNLYSKLSVGGNNSYVFETRDQFIEWLDGIYVRADSFKPELLKIGDVIFIEEMGVPDYWVKSKSLPMTINDFREYEAKIDIPEVKVDDVSVSKNESDELQAIAIKNGRLKIGDTVHRSDFKGWTELSEEQFNSLVEYGSIEIDGEIIKYTDDGVYVTPDTSYSTKQGTVAPTTATEGVVGQFYLDSTTKILYQCVAINIEDLTYEWKQIGGGEEKSIIKRSATVSTPQEIMSIMQELYNNGNTILSMEYNNTKSKSLIFNSAKFNNDIGTIEVFQSNAISVEVGIYKFNFIGKTPDDQGFMFAGNISNTFATLRVYNSFIPCVVRRDYMLAYSCEYGLAEPSMSSNFTATILYI